MELRKAIAPYLLLPGRMKSILYNDLWQKEQIAVALREHEESLTIRQRPLPHLEILFKVSNGLPFPLQIFGANIEIWLGKPVVQFYSFLSELLRPGETRETLRAMTFLNQFQLDLLNPPKKDSLPPSVAINITVLGRSQLGMIEKTVKITWAPPKAIG
jgi:hypothetical protein